MAEIAEKDARITAQDLFNSFACVYDPKIRSKAEKALRKALGDIKAGLCEKGPIRLYVDGSYDPKTGAAGIGIVIMTDPSDTRIDNKKNIAFGKAVNAKSSLTAELYALSIGLSYILDTFPEAGYVHVRYDCVNAMVCATNIDSLSSFGAPYTNFKSALKRVRKKRMNVMFEHVKAHEDDVQNERCDLIARYYSKAKLPSAQAKIARRLLAKGRKDDDDK